MKKLIIKLTVISWLMFLPILTNQIFAQPLPPFSHGSTTDQPAGAPLDGGLSMLVLMAAAYGGNKIRLLRKKEQKKD
ncbi:MAG: hypothetical protein GY756_11345 [bacterium]|nr:hypothetical protein [bacterium]